MANDQFIQSTSIEDYIVLFAGTVIDGFDTEGDAITSAKLRDAGEPVEGSGGYVAQGSVASVSDVLTFRVLRGSNGHRRLRRAVAANTTGRLSIRKRNLLQDSQDSYFSPCAYFTSSTSGAPTIGQDKFEEFTCYVSNPEFTDLTVIT